MMTERDFGRRAIDQMVEDIVHGTAQRNVRWESFTSDFISDVAQARSFVDCGAEYGFYVRLALRHGSPALRITAFEPEPTRYELLRETLPAEVALLGSFVMDRSGTVTARKSGVGFSMSTKLDEGEEIVGRCVALDAMSLRAVDLLKIDIEGAEDEALSGASATLARCRPILYVEWHPVAPRTRAATLGLLQSLGYVVTSEDEAAIRFGGRTRLVNARGCAAEDAS